MFHTVFRIQQRLVVEDKSQQTYRNAVLSTLIQRDNVIFSRHYNYKIHVTIVFSIIASNNLYSSKLLSATYRKFSS